MGWKRSRLAFAVACLAAFSCVLAHAAAPQRAGNKNKQEPFWRVGSEEKKEVVPPYSGGLSPFPVRQKESVKREARILEEKRPGVSKRLVQREAAREKIARASEILRSIREIIKQREAFNPDVSNIVIEAVISGSRNQKILVRNNWIGLGDEVSVPVLATDALHSLIGELEVVDPNLAQIVGDDVEEQIAGGGPMTLKLKSVQKDFVELEDLDGKTHVVSFISSGW